MAANEEMGRYWNEEGGRAWVDQQERFDAQLAVFADAVLDRARPAPGERVLDVGCGTGALTAAVGAAVAPGGSVLGVDVSAPMVAAAEARASEQGVPVRCVLADAQTTDLTGEGPFDLLVSRFGVMFFEDPTAAFTNLRRALAADGRLVFACWQGFDRNPWMSAPMSAALEHLPPPPQLEPDAPGPWAFADPERVGAVLDGAGFEQVSAEALHGELALAGGGDADAAYSFLRSTSLGRLLLQQDDPEVAARVEGAVRAVLAANEVDGEVRLPFAAWLVTARAS